MMEESINPQLVTAIWGAFGSLSINLLLLLEAHNLPEEKRPNLRDPFYWAALCIWPIIAGGLAYAYAASDQSLSPLLAINVGASAPLILRSMASAIPPGGNGQ